MIANDFLWNLYPDDSITKHIQKNKVWEPHIIKFMRKFIKPTHNCYDLGACFGWHTLEMARNTKFGKVIAFEPHKPAINLLKINIIQNNIQNIIVIERAIGDNCSSFLVNAYNKNNINIGESFVNHTYDIHDIVYKNNEKLDVNGVPINIITLDSFYDRKM
jgi:FkbM family methyltransferase